MAEIKNFLFYPSVFDVIKTSLTASEITQRLSTAVDTYETGNRNACPDKPYDGEISTHYFKISKKNERLQVSTEGNIIQSDSGCSVEVISGVEPSNLVVFYILMLIGISPVLFKNFLFGIILFLGLYLVVFTLRTLMVKQQGRQHIKFIRDIIESEKGFDLRQYQEVSVLEVIKWIVIIILCMAFVMWVGFMYVEKIGNG